MCIHVERLVDMLVVAVIPVAVVILVATVVALAFEQVL